MINHSKQGMTWKAALLSCAAVFALFLGALVVQAADDAATAKRKPRVAFTARGTLVGQLNPGATRRVSVKLRNRQKYPIWVTNVRFTFTVDAVHRAAGCSPTRDFQSFQLKRSAFPIKLKARGKSRKRSKKSSRWKTIPVKRAAGRPAIAMPNLTGTNQDACKGASLRLTFKGKAVKRAPRKSRKAASSMAVQP